MTRLTRITPLFVNAIPNVLEPGVLYISIPYATVQHLCACGCGGEVSTPLTPTDWKLVFDGETVSLCPSVGNWSFACESHYWIKNNRVRWSAKWSRDEVDEGRRRAGVATDNRVNSPVSAPAAPDSVPRGDANVIARFWRRVRSPEGRMRHSSDG